MDGDLVNRIADSGSSSERDLAQIRFFTLSDQEAWTVYQKSVSDATNGGGDANVNVIGLVEGSAGGDGSHIQTYDRFSQAFEKAKQVFNQYVATDSYKNASDTYSSVIRDPATMQAWSQCITQTNGAPKFRMVLKRETNDRALARVCYSAGAFAGSLPTLSLAFSGASAEDHVLSIGQGSKIFILDVSIATPVIGVSGQTEDGNTDLSFVETCPRP